MNLVAARREFDYKISRKSNDLHEDDEDHFDILYQNVKEILRKQSDSFWQSRIIDWQQARK